MQASVDVVEVGTWSRWDPSQYLMEEKKPIQFKSINKVLKELGNLFCNVKNKEMIVREPKILFHYQRWINCIDNKNII